MRIASAALMILVLTSGASGGAMPTDALSAVAKAVAATVAVRVPGANGEEQTIGAGFVEATTGRIVTNAHVVAGRDAVRVSLADGEILLATVTARDTVKDIALLSAKLPAIAGLAFADTPPAVGESVYAVGSPFGLGQSVTRGIVSALDRAIDANTPFGMIQHDAPLNPGSSGGPVIDGDGRVIGINTAMPDGFRRDVGIAYAIPAAIAAPAVARLAENGDPLVRELGVSLRALTPRLAAAVGVDADEGVLVESVAPDSIAAKAGISPADVILSIGSTKLVALRDVAVALDRADPSAPLAVVLLSADGERQVVLPPAVAEAPTLPPAKRLRGGAKAAVPAEKLGFTLAEAGEAAVASVERSGAGAAAGIAPGDVVLAVGRTPVASAEDARRLIGSEVAKPFALLLKGRGGDTRYVVVDPWATGLDADALGGNMRDPKSARF